MDYKIIAPRTENSGLIQVLKNRDISNIARFLHTTNDDFIDPASIVNIKAGAKMLINHIQNYDYAYLQVDSDCDGFTSSSIMLNYLNDLFPYYAQNRVIIGIHEQKTHGIDVEEIPECVKLVICPDAGSEEYEKHQILKNRGIDVLIIDHHNAIKYSENACVINDQLGDYPNPSLSGAGMVYKFCCYLDSLLNMNYAQQYLDLTSLGIIADLMDLRHPETRQILDLGLNNLQNPFIQYMINKNSFKIKGVPTPKDFAFSIAPTINGITRIGTLEEKHLLFDSMLNFKAYQEVLSTKRGHKPGEKELLVDQAVRVSTNVSNHQRNIVQLAFNHLEELIEEKHLLDNKILLLQIENPTKDMKNITGLIAIKFVSKYGKPTLVLNKSVEEDGVHWRGSGRNADGIPDFLNLQEYLKETGLVELAAGHDNALGVSIVDENIQAFINKSNQDLINCQFKPQHLIDLVYDAKNPKNIDANDIISIGSNKRLWGVGVQEPKILIKNLTLTPSDIELIGPKRTTLKILVPNTNISLITFSSNEEEYENLLPSANGNIILDVIGTCEINAYGGVELPQIKIIDYEIIERNEYYF